MEEGRRDEFVLNGHRADTDGFAFFTDAAQFFDPVKVDQVGGLGEAQLHHGQQAMASSEQFGFRAQTAQQRDGLANGFGRVVVKCGWDHGRLREVFAGVG